MEGSRNGVEHTYKHALQGYSGYFSPVALNEIRSRPEVKYVEQGVVTKAQTAITQKDAPWGLARISHQTLPTEYTYKYGRTPGKHTCIYIVDSGIDCTHSQLKLNCEWGKTIKAGEPDEDNDGHGTMVAGVAGSQAFGVAKAAKLIAVKVAGVNGVGDSLTDIAGIEWVIGDVKERKGCSKGSIINMSRGGEAFRAYTDAAENAVDKGVYFVTASGNSNTDACNLSPAQSAKVITVGATDSSDNLWASSNWGRCVTLNAPGAWINTTYLGNSNSTLSGTSLAAPHVAGLVAYFLSIYPDRSFPEQKAQQKAIERSRLFLQDQSRWELPTDPTARFFAEEAVANHASVKMTPALMQRFLVKIALRGKIRGRLPAGTPNLIAYNNAELLD